MILSCKAPLNSLALKVMVPKQTIRDNIVSIFENIDLKANS